MNENSELTNELLKKGYEINRDSDLMPYLMVTHLEKRNYNTAFPSLREGAEKIANAYGWFVISCSSYDGAVTIVNSLRPSEWYRAH